MRHTPVQVRISAIVSETLRYTVLHKTQYGASVAHIVPMLFREGDTQQ